MAAGKSKALLAAGVAATGYGLYLLFRWRKYRVLFGSVYQDDGVPVRRKVYKVRFGKVEGENRGADPMDPPVIKDDDLYWLRDDKRKDPDVIAHLNRENAYFEKKFKPLRGLQSAIYQEFVSHTKETDEEVPYPYGPYVYYTRTVQGLSYPIHCRKSRKPGTIEPMGKEEIILDHNVLGKGKSHCDVQHVEMSPDHALLAFTVDFTGYETYDIIVRQLATGNQVDKVEGCAGQIVWGKTNQEFFYTTMDDEHRPHKVWRHKLGQPQSSDECLLTEDDELFWLDIDKTCSGRFLVIDSGSPTRSEVHLLDLEATGATIKQVEPRSEDHRYSVEHWGDHLYIITNTDGCINSKLMQTPIAATGKKNWKDVMPYEKTSKLDYLVCFENHVVINGRGNGLKMCKVMDMRTGKVADLKFDEEAYDTYPKKNREWKTSRFRYGYSSMVTPHSTFEYDMQTGEKQLLKEQTVPKYDRSLYASERVFATAKDGTKVPISLVYRKDCRYAKSKQPSPMMLYGYGSYGICIDPSFDAKGISYLDRGMIFAIAHIRGGGEMGRHWYETEGKYLNKMNTFTDFCDCAEFLIKSGYTQPSQLAISGRSAGGLLMGTVLNLRPDLFKAAVAGVPFVDIMVTMCDPSIPLTITEWEEWGNPNEKKYYDYMLSYSPVDNVKPNKYPSLLITAGLNDPRVPYWEPAKWVARLRAAQTDRTVPMLLKTDMSSGHFSASDRYKLWEERSIEYAFVAHELGCAQLL
jgi:oligopeptidase B